MFGFSHQDRTVLTAAAKDEVLSMTCRDVRLLGFIVVSPLLST